MDISTLEIGGSKAVNYTDHELVGSLVRTEDGRLWYWKADWHTYEGHGFHSFDEGEWVEYHSSLENE